MSAEKRPRILIWRFIFFEVVVFAMVIASLPQPPQITGQPADKVQHILPFLAMASAVGLT